jgi:hypothetical protein
MDAGILASVLIVFLTWFPGLYYLYLHLTKDEEWAKQKLHDFHGDEYRDTEGGAMAIDKDNWVVYLYRR